MSSTKEPSGLPSTKSVSSLLRTIRTERGLSLRTAARQVGIDPAHLARVEKGEKTASQTLQERLSDYYEVDVDTIRLASDQVPSDVIEILQRHPEAIEALRERYGGEDG